MELEAGSIPGSTQSPQSQAGSSIEREERDEANRGRWNWGLDLRLYNTQMFNLTQVTFTRILGDCAQKARKGGVSGIDTLNDPRVFSTSSRTIT